MTLTVLNTTVVSKVYYVTVIQESLDVPFGVESAHERLVATTGAVLEQDRGLVAVDSAYLRHGEERENVPVVCDSLDGLPGVS